MVLMLCSHARTGEQARRGRFLLILLAAEAPFVCTMSDPVATWRGLRNGCFYRFTQSWRRRVGRVRPSLLAPRRWRGQFANVGA